MGGVGVVASDAKRLAESFCDMLEKRRKSDTGKEAEEKVEVEGYKVQENGIWET